MKKHNKNYIITILKVFPNGPYRPSRAGQWVSRGAFKPTDSSQYVRVNKGSSIVKVKYSVRESPLYSQIPKTANPKPPKK